MNKRIFALFLALLLTLTSITGCINLDPSLIEENTTVTEESETVSETESESESKSEVQTPSADDIPLGATLSVHFIDVGQADAALVLCAGKAMLIDGGNKADSDLIYTYLKKQEITHLDYVVATHAHEDHVGGLSGALTAVDTVGHVISPVTDYDTKAFRDFVAKTQAHGRQIEIPHAGDTFSLGDATVTVLGPVKTYTDPNNTSIVLRIVFGETSFLFTGDMESDAEADLIESGATLRSTVLKVGHHGSSTSTSYRFLREVAPSFGVISAGANNSYGHPHEVVLSRLRDAEVKLFRTDLQGDVICHSDGKNVTFTTARNFNVQTNPTENKTQYIGNKSPRIYDLLICANLPTEEKM